MTIDEAKERLEGLRRSNNGWGAEALDIALWLTEMWPMVQDAIKRQAIEPDDYDPVSVLDAVMTLEAWAKEHPCPGS